MLAWVRLDWVSVLLCSGAWGVMSDQERGVHRAGWVEAEDEVRQRGHYSSKAQRNHHHLRSSSYMERFGHCDTGHNDLIELKQIPKCVLLLLER